MSILFLQKLWSLLYLLFMNASLWDQMKFQIGCAPIISNLVFPIYNSPIREGYVPKLWKSADVLPLGKITQPQCVDSDLRPISLTPVLSKVLEGFVFNWIAPLVMPYIDPYQFGNVKKSSTTHAYLLLKNLTRSLEPVS
jgi:hypothetical protein